jgi:hypothetical protein
MTLLICVEQAGLTALVQLGVEAGLQPHRQQRKTKQPG